MFQGNTFKLQSLDGHQGLYELLIDQADASVNVMNEAAFAEFDQVIDQIEAHSDQIRGLLIRSAKSSFILGADVFEFVPAFKRSQQEVALQVERVHQTYNRFEALQLPKVCILEGMALGGGLEFALLAEHRIATDAARIGFPEVSLGICPGWGGTVRGSRLMGWQTALDWMLSGKPQSASAALAAGAVDELCEADQVAGLALNWLEAAVAGQVDWRAVRERKQAPQTDVDPAELQRYVDEQSAKLDTRYPAAIEMLHAVTGHLGLAFDTALDIEAQLFAKLAKTDVATALIGNFVNEQAVKRLSRKLSRDTQPVSGAAVLGAGIMGGGIAYQSALSGVPIKMKDIRTEALDLGISTAAAALDKQVKRGKLTESGKADVLAGITPQLDYAGFEGVDLVVEAVVENEAIKKSVLTETEAVLSEDAILTSNTSTISIDSLASVLKRPEQFCGMHFFNPVPAMPLVEVIRGHKTSDATINRTVAYALALGKTPIVVNDCPGFLVNRVLFPYFNGFNRLLMDGVDFQRIDAVMEQFGWPMGPAYLADVVGIDTMVHADQVLQAGFPDRMLHDQPPMMEWLFEESRLGQKSGRGFYRYGKDENGRRTKVADPEVVDQINSRVTKRIQISDQEIIDRMMIPMCTESVRCLDEGIVGSAAELDMALLMGLGFPRFRGGSLRYIESLGLKSFAVRCDHHAALGGLYQLTDALRERAAENRNFYN